MHEPLINTYRTLCWAAGCVHSRETSLVYRLEWQKNLGKELRPRFIWWSWSYFEKYLVKELLLSELGWSTWLHPARGSTWMPSSSALLESYSSVQTNQQLGLPVNSTSTKENREGKWRLDLHNVRDRRSSEICYAHPNWLCLWMSRAKILYSTEWRGEFVLPICPAENQT